MKSTLMFIVLFLGYFTGGAQEVDPLNLSLKCSFQSKMAGSALPMIATFKNTSSDSINFLLPRNVSKMLEFFRGSEKMTSPNKCLSAALIPRFISLSPGEKFDLVFDLKDIYGVFLKSGNYSCKFTYATADKKQLSRTVKFKLLPLSSYELESKKELTEVFHFYEGKGFELGKAYLEKYSNSIFANSVRMKVAHFLRRSYQYEKSVPYYQSIANSKEVTKGEISSAIFYEAHSWYMKGDLDQATIVLGRNPDNVPKEIIRHWGPTRLDYFFNLSKFIKN